MFKATFKITAIAVAAVVLAASSVFAAEVSTFAGTGIQDEADNEYARFNMPMGIATGQDGRLFVADTFNNMIRVIDAEDGVVSLNNPPPTLDPWGLPIGGHVDRYLENAMFSHPSGFSLGLHGWLFTADTRNNAIRVIIGNRVYTMAGMVAGFEDGYRFSARFSSPSAVAVSPDGSIYVADTGNHAIRRISMCGNVVTVAGFSGEHGYENGSADKALFDSPMGLAFSDDGRLFIADTGNNVIRVMYDGYVSTYAGLRFTTEREGDFGDFRLLPVGALYDGTVDEALFNRPMGLAFYEDILFVADSGSHAIRAVVDGRVITIAGTGWLGREDGRLDAASFHTPKGLYVYGELLLVADMGNSLIRSISLAAAIERILDAE